MSTQDPEVLIAGAGPTGLVLALWLTRLGVRVRIVDTTEGPGTTSRALAVQARTLELYRQMDLAETVVAAGHKVPALDVWVRGRRKARIGLHAAGAGMTPYPFPLIYPQDAHERLLIARLESLGVRVARGTELISFAQEDDGVRAVLRGADGLETCEAAYIAGCDGARSVVREGIGAAFPGGTYAHLFYVADVEATGPMADGELHVALDTSDFLAVFPMTGVGRARLVGSVGPDGDDAPGELTFADVSQSLIRRLKIEIGQVHWFSTYRVHHRVADRFRRGRAFLLGDAAHIHSPAGGQGMNTGIGDAINLAWKLEAVLRGRAAPALLESYEAERIGFARRLVATTDRAFSLATAPGGLAREARTRIAPLILPILARVDALRRWAFRAVSQMAVTYRDGPLARGRAGRVRGGDRMPWTPTEAGDNYPTGDLGWQAQVFGEARDELAPWCARRGVTLRVFPWREGFRRVGLARDAVYLVRPDAYVGLAEPSGSVEALERYLTDHGFPPESGLLSAAGRDASQAG